MIIPMLTVRRAARIFTAAALVALGPGSAIHEFAQEYVPQKNEALPKIKYADSQISVNDRCPVRHGKLNPKVDPVYVNSQPVGFC